MAKIKIFKKNKNTCLGTIMPVYMKNGILPKELALVERELISELDNVEIY